MKSNVWFALVPGQTYRGPFLFAQPITEQEFRWYLLDTLPEYKGRQRLPAGLKCRTTNDFE